MVSEDILLGGLVAMNFIFPEILGISIIIPIDFHTNLFQRGSNPNHQSEDFLVPGRSKKPFLCPIPVTSGVPLTGA